MRISRFTGAGGGLIIVLVGIWVGIIPFVGPYFDYGFGPNLTWHLTLDRVWLDVLPGAAAVLGGLMMIGASRRTTGVFGAWIALAGGVWLLLGPSASLFWQHPAPGTLISGIGSPLGGHDRAAIEMVGFFYGAGALITVLAGIGLGRFISRPPTVPIAPQRSVEETSYDEGVGREPPTTSRPAGERRPVAEPLHRRERAEHSGG